MKLLEIVRLGHPALRAKSTKVTKKELKTKKFQKFLDQLAATCDANSGVGIAAAQVGINKRVIVVHVDPANPRYKDKLEFPQTAIVNPRVIKRSSEISEDWEGDLSCGLRALVPRPISCVVRGLNREGQEVEFNLDYSFHARVFQHEIDHLNGVFLIDRVKHLNTLTEYAEWKKYWKNPPPAI